MKVHNGNHKHVYTKWQWGNQFLFGWKKMVVGAIRIDEFHIGPFEIIRMVVDPPETDI